MSSMMSYPWRLPPASASRISKETAVSGRKESGGTVDLAATYLPLDSNCFRQILTDACPLRNPAGSDSRSVHLVMQLYDVIGKLLYTEQAERHLTMPRCQEGNAFPDEGWHDGDDELVNRVLVQEGPDDLASAHHPDVLASLGADAFG